MADALEKREEDTYPFQRARVLRVINELAPGKIVEFDESTSMIRFRVRDPFLNIDLTDAWPHWLPSELADKSDDELRLLVRNLSGGKIG